VKPIKSTAVMFGIVAATTVSASAFAHHRDWHDGGPRARAYPERYVVVPRTDVTVGFVAGAPAAGYYYEPAPRYYYYEQAPAYYYEPAPAYYYYDNQPAFPRSNSKD
jgi:hypothetical protein